MAARALNGRPSTSPFARSNGLVGLKRSDHGTVPELQLFGVPQYAGRDNSHLPSEPPEGGTPNVARRVRRRRFVAISLKHNVEMNSLR
jgi:hypothetical protein